MNIVLCVIKEGCDYETRIGNLNKTSALIEKIDAFEDVVCDFDDMFNLINIADDYIESYNS